MAKAGRWVTVAGIGLLIASAAAAQEPRAAADGATDPIAPTGRWSANVRGRAATPPMGWNSWNAFETAIDEDKVIGTARALVDTGLARLGYRHVNIDDGWWLRRRQSDKRLQIRTPIFPSANVGGREGTSFRPLTDRLHAMGLKAGIYTDIGHNSCSQSHSSDPRYLPEGTVAEREVGLAGNVERDIALYFGSWGFDYIKVDACGIDQGSQRAWQKRGADYTAHATPIVRTSVNRSDVREVIARYTQVGDAIARARPGGDYVFSICAWGSANVRAWGKDIGNLVRTSDDIRPVWSRMLHTFDSAATRPLYAQPGAWNDPDMLFVGHGDFDAKHLTEARSHFSLWAIINAPLLIGYDMRRAPKALLDIWGNADLVRANQDAGGHQGVITYRSDDVQIIVKTLAGSDRKIVALFNRGLAPATVKLAARHMRFADGAPIVLRDLWTRQRLPAFTDMRELALAPRQTLVFEASGTRLLADGHYLSELPGRVNVAHDGVISPQADPVTHRMVNPWEGTIDGGTPAIYAGWGGAAADESPYAAAIQTGGRIFDIGIGILANSRIEVRSDREYRRFTATVGVDDNSLNTRDPVRFLIYADGRLVGRTAALRYGDPPVALAADIAGSRIVELVVAQADGKVLPVTAAWGDAALLR